jgi:hypothetical protein
MRNKKKIFCLLLLGPLIAIMLVMKPAQALNLGIHIPEKYLEVVAGERLAFEVDIKYPENPGRKDLRMTYQIKKGGEVLSESKTLKAIETQSSFMDYMVVPGSLEVGTYTISNIVQDYVDLNENISASFRVIKGKEDLMKYIYILGAAMGIVIVFVFFELLTIISLKKELKS